MPLFTELPRVGVPSETHAAGYQINPTSVKRAKKRTPVGQRAHMTYDDVTNNKKKKKKKNEEDCI